MISSNIRRLSWMNFPNTPSQRYDIVHDITAGQRWISDTEIDMGLGTILTVEHRTITVVFLATGETRTYAKQTAPLTRVRFEPGDSIHNQTNETLQVTSVSDQDGRRVYHGISENSESLDWRESQLDNVSQLNRPTERLFAGQLDANKWFELRYQSLRHANRLAHSDLYGLTGVRTSLIPHQLFIAHEVAHRYAPRVLLADEVGLGKTIEAGLILHQQLLTERAKRVLIIVPESLVHQWLVEMLRRFNLHFSVFDEERCLGIEEDSEQGSYQNNPFQTEQLILCSQDFLTANPARFQQVLAGEWDLLVVDEAHHLQWSPTESSPEYQLIEALAARTKGVLLLTATPEQLGKESHFARLRLLDPNRFPSYELFLEEENHYRPIAEAVEELLNTLNIDKDVSEKTLATLQEVLVDNDNADNAALINTLSSPDVEDNTDVEPQSTKQHLVDMLLDRHGTGRVLFRNTRAAVKGFPERCVNAYPLTLPSEYAGNYETFLESHQSIDLITAKSLLCPDILPKSDPDQENWTSFDPRIDWLQESIKTHKPEKILVIAANASTALGISQVLKTRSGMHIPVFHENLSIIERDRAAAHFADMENGGQVLICSEIGSEGRNFQFSHHLVLFDLPLNPDLLEQRIGRLDRIGQTETIQIHVPYFIDSPQSLMFNWYQNALSAFEKTCPVGPNVFKKLQVEFLEMLSCMKQSTQHEHLIEAAGKLSKDLNETLHKGRDILLEYNSCLPTVANKLIENAKIADENSGIQDYLENVFDCFGVDTEIHSNDCYIVRPGDHMHSHFPGLSEEGMKVTFNRDLALSNEDMHFVSWEHPLASGALDLVLSNETGNTALAAIKTPNLTPGTMCLECVYILEPVAQKALQSKRYLPPTTIRLVVDHYGKNITRTLTHTMINQSLIPVDAETPNTVIRSKTREIKSMVEESEQLAMAQKPRLITAARKQIMETLEPEIERLLALKAHNPNIRDEEIDFFESQRDAINSALESANVRLDALRIVVST